MQIKIRFFEILVFCFSVILVLISFSCKTIPKNQGETIAQKQINQIQTGFKNIPSGLDKNCDMYEQLEVEYAYCRNIIASKINDFIVNSDTVVFIEEFRNDFIGYQKCYIYSSNHKQMKCYEAIWSLTKEQKIMERQTYTLAELEYPIRNRHIPSYNDFPKHFSEKLKLELIESVAIPEFKPGYIVVSIQDGILSKCLEDIRKQCRTPSAYYNIALATKINNDYVFQYFSASECETYINPRSGLVNLPAMNGYNPRNGSSIVTGGDIHHSGGTGNSTGTFYTTTLIENPEVEPSWIMVTTPVLRGVSEACFLIDITRWSSFIGHFPIGVGRIGVINK